MKWISFFLISKSVYSLGHSSHFIRVFNSNNQKILKGKIIYVSDSGILVSTITQIVELPASEIEYIKTNRSLGHYMLLSGLVFFIVVFSTNLLICQPVSQLILGATIQKAGINALAAMLPGALLGFAMKEAKPPSCIVVNKDFNRWRKVNQSLRMWIAN